MDKKRKKEQRKIIWLILALISFVGSIVIFLNRSGLLDIISAVLFFVAGVMFLISYFHIQSKPNIDSSQESNGGKESVET